MKKLILIGLLLLPGCAWMDRQEQRMQTSDSMMYPHMAQYPSDESRYNNMVGKRRWHTVTNSYCEECYTEKDGREQKSAQLQRDSRY